MENPMDGLKIGVTVLVIATFIAMFFNLKQAEAPTGTPTSTITPQLQATQQVQETKKPAQNATTITPQLQNATKTPEIVFDGVYKKWNEEKKCYDESNLPKFEPQAKDESLFYDPNWLVCNNKADGCLFCFVPNQGKDNQWDEKDVQVTIF